MSCGSYSRSASRITRYPPAAFSTAVRLAAPLPRLRGCRTTRSRGSSSRARRSGGNQRRYERAELRRVAFIRIAAQVGVPLEEIKAALDGLPDSRTPTAADWAKLSARWRQRLEDQIGLLQRLRDKLTGCI